MIRQTWYFQQQALLRQITNRIRNSLELKTVLQTAVNEVQQFLSLDRCLFFWYRPSKACIQIVCQQEAEPKPNALMRVDQVTTLGHYELSTVQAAARWIEQGALAIYDGPSRYPKWLQTQLSWRQPSAVEALEQPCGSILGATAYLLVPVQGRDGVTGYVACLSNRSRRWSTLEVEFMQSIAQQLEIAVCQAQLYGHSQKLARREQLVNQITRQTRRSLDVETVLTQAIAQLLDALEVDRCLIHLVEDVDERDGVSHAAQVLNGSTFRRKHLFEVCRSPFPGSIDDFDTNGPITQWVVRHRQMVVISDVRQDSRIGTENLEYQKAQIKSSLVVPVQSNGKLRAILYLNQCSQVRYWSQDDQTLAQAVADQLAITIQQSQLYAQTRQQALESAAQAQHLSETLRKLQQTQAQLIQSEKMSSLGQMVAGVAHEINNPISFIYGNIPYVERYIDDLVQLLQAYQTAYPESSPELKALIAERDIEFVLQDLPRILSSMQSGAQRIREIVQALRNFSRLDEASNKITDIHAGLDSAIALLKPQFRPDIQLMRHYGELPPVDCYPRLLNQVFMNLLMNSLEALNRQGHSPKTLSIDTETFTPSRSQAPWVRITIADNGPGISLEMQPRIFDPFFTTKEVGQGTGLGLAVSYQIIVEQHQGRLHCESVPGQGATFMIEIPTERVERSPKVAPMPASVPLRTTFQMAKPEMSAAVPLLQVEN